MSKIITDSHVAHILAQTASLKAAAALKQIRNDAASDREHLRLMRKVEHEFDGSLGRGGVLRRGLARIKNNSLTVPAERKRQLQLSTAGRSFHGKGATYRKERPTADAKKRRRSASSGAADYKYIDGADQCEPLANEFRITESHVSYIDGCRVETNGDGDRFSRTNIEGNFVDRANFFALTEGFERNSHGDKITLDPNRPNAELAAATTDPACDPALRTAVAKLPLPHNGKSVKIQLKGTNEDLRRHLTRHGMELSTARLNKERLATDGIAFNTGRSGRTHFRWVFELPVEFTARQRKMVLEDLCKYMDQERCMYASVVHAPDAGNDERNYHLHLIFYDRPCRRMTGTEADLQNVAEDLKSEIREDIAAKKIKKGEWDFTVERHYFCNRSWKTHYPFRAAKSREVTKGKDWQARFRRNYATIVNEVSVKTGSGAAIYDPRSYNDRDVDISPSKHLGQLHASEVSGIPTLIGLSNERNQANDQRRALIVRHEAEMARLCSFEARLSPYLPGEAVNPRASNWAAYPLRNITDAQHAAEASLAMEFWLLETARERSRATLVQDRQKRASQKGPALEQQQREELATAAEMHLAGLDRQDASMQRIIDNVQYEIKSATVITAEAVERTASNCAVFTRGYLSSVTPKVTRKQNPDISVAPPTCKPKFKKQMAKLAAEMIVPVPNPELHAGIAQQMKAMKKNTSVPSTDKSVVNIAPNVPKLKEATDYGLLVDRRLSSDGTAEPRPSVAAARPLIQPLTLTSTRVATPTTGPLPQKTPNDVEAGNRKPKSTHNVDYLASIKSDNWAVRHDPNDPAQMTLYQTDMTAFWIEPGGLQQSEVQAQLLVNYNRQQEELAKLGAAVRDGIIPVLFKEDMMGRRTIRLDIAPGSRHNDIYQRCIFHPQFEEKIKLAHGDATEACRSALQAPADLAGERERRVGTETSIPETVKFPNIDDSTVTTAATVLTPDKEIAVVTEAGSVTPGIELAGEAPPSQLKQPGSPTARIKPSDVVTHPSRLVTFTPEEGQEILRNRSYSHDVIEGDGLNDASKSIGSLEQATNVATKAQMPELVTQSATAIGANESRDRAIEASLQSTTSSDEAGSKEHPHPGSKKDTVVAGKEHYIDSRYDTQADTTSVDVLVEKFGQNNKGLSSADVEATGLGSLTEQEAAMRRSEFEKEAILHVVRIERIRLQRVDGKMVLPQHELIRANWHRHVPFLQVQLEGDQRLIENELEAFVRNIGSSAYKADSPRTMFFHKVFEGQPEVAKGLAERQRNATELLARQHALAANQGFGFS